MSNEAKHTPGPWKVGTGFCHWLRSPGIHNRLDHTSYHFRNDGEEFAAQEEVSNN